MPDMVEVHNWRCDCGVQGFEYQNSPQQAEANSLDHKCSVKRIELITALEPNIKLRRKKC